MKMTDNKVMWLTMLVCAMLQMPAVVLGFDWCDTGFYMTFYDNILDTPASVEYNFMYYLSGVAGGLWLKLFPDAGIFGIKILGMLTNVTCIFLLFRIYRGVLPALATSAGCLLVTVAYLQLPMAFYNDTLTALLLVAGVGLLIKGMNRSPVAVAAAGVVLGINAFARVPNVLDAGLIVLAPICYVLFHRSQGFLWGRMLAFAAGYAAGVCFVFVLMLFCHHLDLYSENVARLLTGSIDGHSSTHSLDSLVGAQLKAYLVCLKVMLKLLGCGFMLWLVYRYVKPRWLSIVACLLITAVTVNITLHTTAVYIVAATVLPALVLEIVGKGTPTLKFYAWGALLVALIFPLGSDGAMSNNGSIVYWLGAPIAMHVVYSLLKKHTDRAFSKTASIVALSVAGVCMIVTTALSGTYFDGRPLWQMTSEIDSPRASLQLTTPERAATAGAIIEAVESLVEPGGTLMAFGSMPMVNYLTDTRPAIGCSWPELLDEQTLERRLDDSPAPHAILVQRFPTIGSQYRPSSAGFAIGEGNDTNSFHNAAKCAVVNGYISRMGYTPAVATTDFILYTLP